MGKTFYGTERGYSLIELLITIAIFSLVLAGIYTTFDSAQKDQGVRKQTIWMQQQARLAMMRLEKDLKMIGYGFVDVGTFKLNCYDANSNASTTWPLLVATDTNTSLGNVPGSDAIEFRYFDGPLDVSQDVILTGNYSSPDTDTPVSLATGFNAGDFYYVCDPNDRTINASLLQVSSTPTGTVIPHTSGSGYFNPPNGTNIFPRAYAQGCKVVNLGQGKFKWARYMIDGNLNLVKQTRDDPSKPIVNHVVASGIEDMQIEYQFKDTQWLNSPVTNDANHDINNLRAVKISIIVRSQEVDRSFRSTASYRLTDTNQNHAGNNPKSFSGGGYRRMIMSTTISLRNMAIRG